MQLDSKIYIAGLRKMAGSVIIQNLSMQGFTNIIGKTSIELNLMNQLSVKFIF